MKSFVRLSALIAFSLLSCGLFARNAGMPQAAEGKTPAAASTAATQGEPLAASPQFVIPGPLKPFLRLAGISQKVSAEEVLPLLSRNVFTEGFQGTSRPTEFLVLLRRYVVQARELAELAGHSGTVIRVSNCDDASPLLLILGYRTKGKCGDPELSLQTEDAERAFLAIDSGFPMAELEQTLQGGKPFEYAYTSTPAPVLFNESDWTKASTKNFKENSRDLLDTLHA